MDSPRAWRVQDSEAAKTSINIPQRASIAQAGSTRVGIIPRDVLSISSGENLVLTYSSSQF